VNPSDNNHLVAETMANEMVMAKQTSLEHAFAEINGVRFHYVKAGAGPLLLFVHGFPQYWYWSVSESALGQVRTAGS
jgi:hypothetical protein